MSLVRFEIYSFPLPISIAVWSSLPTFTSSHAFFSSLAYKWVKYQTEKVFINQVYHASLLGFEMEEKILWIVNEKWRKSFSIFSSWSRLFTLSQMYFDFLSLPSKGCQMAFCGKRKKTKTDDEDHTY